MDEPHDTDWHIGYRPHTNIEELQAAIELVARDMEFMNKRLLQEGITPDPQSDLVLEAARMWLNPNYYEAAKAVGWVNKPGARETIQTIVAAALTPQGDTDHIPDERPGSLDAPWMEEPDPAALTPRRHR